MISRSLILILDSEKGESKGTGFIIRYNGDYYAVTCRHVINSLNVENLVGITTPKRTQKLNPEKLLTFRNIIFHPDDDDENTYDIAICNIANYENVKLDNPAIEYIEIDDNIELNFGDKIKVLGYPIDSIKSQLSENTDQELRFSEIHGEVIGKTPAGLTPSGFTGKLIESFWANSTDDNVLGSGASGGIIILDQGDSNLPYGIQIGSAGINTPQKDIIPLGFKKEGLIFAQMQRVIEALRGS